MLLLRRIERGQRFHLCHDRITEDIEKLGGGKRQQLLAMERLLVDTTLGSSTAPYSCREAVVYRLAAPQADHYFLLNDEPAKQVVLDTGDFAYRSCEDAITGETLGIGEPIAVDGWSGRWLRFSK